MTIMVLSHLFVFIFYTQVLLIICTIAFTLAMALCKGKNRIKKTLNTNKREKTLYMEIKSCIQNKLKWIITKIGTTN